MLEEGLDVAELYAIAEQLANSEPERARFSVDAGHLNRLGYELVTKKETAVGELIKNAYDADSPSVRLIFSGNFDTLERAKRDTSCLKIVDTGEGMTREEIIAGFMRLSTPMKLQSPRSTKNRYRAGSKGIGRFATQRLGRRLDVYTKHEDDEVGWHLTINWERFEARSSLHSVASRLVQYPNLPSGTSIVISQLRDAWAPSAITQLRNFIAPLVEPASPDGTPRTGNEAFNVYIERPKLDPINVQDEVYSELIQSSLAYITGTVDQKSVAHISVASTTMKWKTQFDIKDENNAHLRDLRKVKFFAYYFNTKENGYTPLRGTATVVRTQLRAHGGIRLYRNGFKVAPYGDPDNDWLSLDAQYRKRQRPFLFPFGNGNFFGYVTINDPSGSLFQEAASREGLLETPAFDQLRSFMLHSLLRAVQLIDTKRKSLGVSKPTTEKDIRDKLSLIQRSARALRSARSTTERLTLIGDIERDTRSVQRQLKKYSTEHIEETGMLRVLASLGITLSGFIHELGQTITFILADLRAVASKLPARSKKRLDDNAALLEDFTRYFDSVLRDNSSRELHELELHDVMNQFESFASAICRERGVTLTVSVEGFDVFTKPMHMSEWSAILLNLLSNSIKAIRRSGKPGNIQVRAFEENGNVVVDFSDDGDGIPPENREKIFYPFFTTSTAMEDEISGMGLGLKIVSDVVTSNRGTISLVDAPAGFATSFRVIVPAKAEVHA